MNGRAFHGLRNASTMPVFKPRNMGFDAAKMKELVDAAKDKGLIQVVIERCAKCSNPAISGRPLCEQHALVYSLGQTNKKIHIRKNCAICGNEFITAYKPAMYCSYNCKVKSHNLRRKPKPRKPKKEVKCHNSECRAPFFKKSWNHKYCPTCGPLFK